MTGWAEFLIAGLIFMASHAVPANPRIKGRIVALLGPRGWVWGFSLLSTGLLFWVIFAAGRAPFVELWPQAGWMRWLLNIAMPLAVVLGTFGVAAPNPFAFEGRADGFDPDRPGIAGVVRQPLLWALILWSGAHLIANGDLSHAILFGVFLAFSLMGMRAMEARKRRLWGEAEWARLAANTSDWPFQALIAGRWRPRRGPSLMRLGLAVVLWAGIFHLHAPVIGFSPLP
ncbi:NnrU family protein [Sedimentimonas flavescens]|uniref:NnrU family protein n=1 Tax=Sedimentimonas flavescens TaxID=2851012 RepID=UPI001C4A7365|nr:NnrU family protein [Sedimentimonas flavescens]MBW0158472.1 NnrU family protein [Sedimentimonas flavescens]MCT2540984.1 NnrU family protein [Sedimentimonas flavescens]